MPRSLQSSSPFSANSFIQMCLCKNRDRALVTETYIPSHAPSLSPDADPAPTPPRLFRRARRARSAARASPRWVSSSAAKRRVFSVLGVERGELASVGNFTSSFLFLVAMPFAPSSFLLHVKRFPRKLWSLYTRKLWSLFTKEASKTY